MCIAIDGGRLTAERGDWSVDGLHEHTFTVQLGQINPCQ